MPQHETCQALTSTPRDVAVKRPPISIIGLISLLGTAAAVHTKSAVDVYERVFRSVVVVHGIDPQNGQNSIGSGVVLPSGDIATACHVLKDASSSVVKHAGREYSARVEYADIDRDICLLRLPMPIYPSISFGATDGLKVGQRVYAVGAPKGLELTLSEGVVSSFRAAQDIRYIQTTAAVSPGSSGGGLFDEEGRLVGLLVFYLRDGQQLNFAVPVEWIPGAHQFQAESSTIRQQVTPKSTIPKTSESSSGQAVASDPQCVELLAQRSRFLDRAAAGNALAQYCVAKSYLPMVGSSRDDPARECRNEAEAEKWFELSAKQGLADAQFNFGIMLILRKESERAAVSLRKAAESGHGAAMLHLGWALEHGSGVPKNEVDALMWLNLAAARGQGATSRDMLSSRLSREEVREAQRLSSSWKPKPKTGSSAVNTSSTHCD
jgi:hypothetical protein